tara:strand:- start:144 stop:353 length:210 start_codon:yes stop_codon:yes gene_type:complete
MKNNTDWIHPDNNLGEMSIDITSDDAYEMLEGEVFDWCFPVYNRDENGVKFMVGNVNIEIGDLYSEEEE